MMAEVEEERSRSALDSVFTTAIVLPAAEAEVLALAAATTVAPAPVPALLALRLPFTLKRALNVRDLETAAELTAVVTFAPTPSMPAAPAPAAADVAAAAAAAEHELDDGDDDEGITMAALADRLDEESAPPGHEWEPEEEGEMRA